MKVMLGLDPHTGSHTGLMLDRQMRAVGTCGHGSDGRARARRVRVVSKA
jgi:hypothetical protein